MADWHARFFNLAKQVSNWSKDPNKKVGCVITRPDRSVCSIGYNGFPRGIADLPERLQIKEIKNQLVIHAEANAILNSRDHDHATHTLYCTSFCCCSCSGLIIQKGIREVVVPTIDPHSSWYANFQSARNILDEAGVTILWVDPNTGCLL